MFAFLCVHSLTLSLSASSGVGPYTPSTSARGSNPVRLELDDNNQIRVRELPTWCNKCTMNTTGWKLYIHNPITLIMYLVVKVLLGYYPTTLGYFRRSFCVFQSQLSSCVSHLSLISWQSGILYGARLLCMCAWNVLLICIHSNISISI